MPRPRRRGTGGFGNERGLAAALLYIAGTIGVTVLCRVLRKNQLARLARDAGATEIWARGVAEWTAWNLWTAAALAAAASFTVALL